MDRPAERNTKLDLQPWEVSIWEAFRASAIADKVISTEAAADVLADAFIAGARDVAEPRFGRR